MPPIEGPQHPTPKDYPAFLKFLSRCYGFSNPRWFENDAAFFFGRKPGQLKTKWAFKAGNRFASHVGLFPYNALVEGRSLKVAGIGAVATDPDFRGQGLMKRLMGHLLVQMAKEDYALSLLWGERDLYGSYGYERALSLPQFHFQERTLRSFVPSQGLRPVRPSDLPLLKKLFEAHPFRAQRPEGYLASVLRKFRSGNAKPAWVLEREGRVCAYSVVLGPVSGGLTVAEWGGAAEDVACLWAGLLKTFKATYVSATLYPQGDLYEWARAKASSRTWTDQSCMIKVLDLYRVLKAFEPQLQKRYAIVGHRVHKTLFFRMEDGSGAGLECGRRLKVVKSRGRGKDLPLSSAETVRLLFGAGWPSGEIRSLMGGEGWLDGLFPLDWYWWRSDWF